jgi:hypothetical protein
MARRIGIVLLVVLAMGATAAPSQPTTSTSSTTTSTSTTTSPTTSSAPSTTAATTPAPTAPDCADVLAGGEQGSLGKTLVGGDEQAAFEVFRIQTDRPAGVYHVVDCIRAPQPGPPFKPAIIDTVDLGEVHIAGTATFRVDIPGSAVPGEEVCDRFVVSGRAGACRSPTSATRCARSTRDAWGLAQGPARRNPPRPEAWPPPPRATAPCRSPVAPHGRCCSPPSPSSAWALPASWPLAGATTEASRQAVPFERRDDRRAR